jgi:PKD repeat protein
LSAKHFLILGVLVILFGSIIISSNSTAWSNSRDYVDNIPPTVDIQANVTNGLVPLYVMFTGIGDDVDGIIINYYWDFDDSADTDNDGNYTNDVDRSGKNVKWTFERVGNYRVTLNVIDNNSGFGKDTILINVSTPRIKISADRREGYAPLKVRFSVEIYNTALTQFEWHFDDGSTSNERNPTHTFQESGYYVVYLNASDGGDIYDFDDITVFVRGRPETNGPDNGKLENRVYFWGTIYSIIFMWVGVSILYFALWSKKKLL